MTIKEFLKIRIQTKIKIFVDFQLHYYYSKHECSFLFCEKVFDSSCSRVSVVSLIFFFKGHD